MPKVVSVEVKCSKKNLDIFLFELDDAIDRCADFDFVLLLINIYNLGRGRYHRLKLISDKGRLVDFIAPCDRYFALVNLETKTIEHIFKTRHSRPFVINNLRPFLDSNLGIFCVSSSIKEEVSYERG